MYDKKEAMRDVKNRIKNSNVSKTVTEGERKNVGVVTCNYVDGESHLFIYS